jgi:hypothetical protein
MHYSIGVVGAIEQSAMVLLGNVYDFSGSSAKFRGTWTPDSDGSVRQFFEQYNEESKSGDAWFNGRYVRKKL